MDERWRLLRVGQHVLDLGAAPGSWAKYAAERVGPAGRVVAVDLQEIRESLGAAAVVVQADVLGEEAPPEVEASAPYDVVLSDMAPATTGSKATDQARSFELFVRAVEIAARLGRPGSSFVGKIFMSGDFPEAKRAVASRYATCRALKPEGTRQNSSELYLVGTGLRVGWH